MLPTCAALSLVLERKGATQLVDENWPPLPINPLPQRVESQTAYFIDFR